MKRIAIVEDNPDGRKLVGLLLGERYRLRFYRDGTSALAGLPADPPDLVLLDISLPDVDGDEVLRRLRAEPRLSGVPVIALTAHTLPEDRERLLRLGFDGHVEKPLLEPGALYRTIETFLQHGEEDNRDHG